MIQFRDYQGIAIQAIYHWFNNNPTGNPLVVMPTGTGKSLVIAGLCADLCIRAPHTRILVMTHVKELIAQNAEKLELVGGVPFGIYSAGLRQKQYGFPVTFGGVMTVKNSVEDFGRIDLLMVDECHLIGPNANATYQVIIAKLQEANPNMRIIGFTATDFRMGVGRLTDEHEGRIFTDIAVNMGTVEWFNWFVQQGYLVPLLAPSKLATEIDLSSVPMQNGDYQQGALQNASNRWEITNAALNEAVWMGQQRRSWLAFCSGIEHADDVAQGLRDRGIAAASVHSKMHANERDHVIRALKSGELRAVSNNGVLTTGFDHPMLDMIIMLRATLSPGLWVQMLGRGTRPSPLTYKQNCLVLDYARNTAALGPINDPVIPKLKGKGGGEVPIKICEGCGDYNHIAARFCKCCGAEFEIQVKFQRTAGNADLIREIELPHTDFFDVIGVTYTTIYSKKDETAMLKVNYHVAGGARRFTELMLFEHNGLAKHKAHQWWRDRAKSVQVRQADGTWTEEQVPVPDTVAEARMNTGMLKTPRRINVHVNKKPYPEIIGYEF